MKKGILLILYLLVASYYVKAQYYVTVKGETIPLEIDSVLLEVENNYDNINWQVSTDSTVWIDLDNGNNYKVWIDSAASYRAISNDKNCPVVSDTIFVGINKIKVDNEFSMNDQGKVYELPSGLIIIVPPNAILGINSFLIEELDSIQTKNHLSFPADSGKTFIYAMKFNATDTILAKPIKVRIPAPKLKQGDLPRIFLFNPETDQWVNYTGYILCNRKSGYIEIRVDKLLPFRVDVYPEALLFTNNENNKELKYTGEKNNVVNQNDSCYDLIRIETLANDFITLDKNQECFFLKETGTVVFLTCLDKLNDYWHIREINESCIPQVEVTINHDPNKEVIKVGEEIVLTFFTYIDAGGEKNPLPEQFVSCSLPEGLQSDRYYWWTNENGKCDFLITATSKNLNATINCMAQFNYCLELIEVSSMNSFEGNCKHSFKLDVTLDKKVSIVCDTPLVVTLIATNVTDTTAQLNGNATSDCGDIITERGFFWSTTNEDPGNNDYIEAAGEGLGEFSVTLSNLLPETTYYYRAFTTNSEGTFTGSVQSFITLNNSCDSGVLTDVDGNIYRTVLIGTQCWMAENLATTKYNDETPISYIHWNDLFTLSTGAYCVPDNSYPICQNFIKDYTNTYGLLYNWYAVETNKLCPEGWYVPSDDDWKELEMYIGLSQSEADGIDGRGTNEATLRSSTIWWEGGCARGTDNYGFNALPGGLVRFEYSGYSEESSFLVCPGRSSGWWTSTHIQIKKPGIVGLVVLGIGIMMVNLIRVRGYLDIIQIKKRIFCTLCKRLIENNRIQ